MVAEAPAEPLSGTLARATFGSLAPGDVSFRPKERPGAAPARVVVIEDYPELERLARDEQFLREMAASTGGEYRELVDFEECLRTLRPKERVEKEDTVWRLWDWGVVLALVVAVLTLEWVWRKLVGLV